MGCVGFLYWVVSDGGATTADRESILLQDCGKYSTRPSTMYVRLARISPTSQLQETVQYRRYLISAAEPRKQESSPEGKKQTENWRDMREGMTGREGKGTGRNRGIETDYDSLRPGIMCVAAMCKQRRGCGAWSGGVGGRGRKIWVSSLTAARPKRLEFDSSTKQQRASSSGWGGGGRGDVKSRNTRNWARKGQEL